MSNGEEEIFTVDSDALKVSENEDLFQGDYLGSTFEWRAGPLLVGLMEHPLDLCGGKHHRHDYRA